MSWKRLFSERVLNRGYDYWCSGAANIVFESGGVVKAVVVGSDDYCVDLQLDETGAVIEMSTVKTWGEP